jgi:mannosyltransferase OCH1-like enzyme
MGGIFLDIDVECIQSLDKIVETQGIVLEILTGSSERVDDFEIPNAVISSPPNHKFWDLVISEIIHTERSGVESITGSIFLSKAFTKYMRTLREREGDPIALNHKGIQVFTQAHFIPLTKSPCKYRCFAMCTMPNSLMKSAEMHTKTTQ